MAESPPLLLILLWAAWLLQAALSTLQAIRFHHKIRRRVRERYADYRPSAFVIVPAKGLDDDLPVHLNALCEQDYLDYQLVFVVESKDDPAYSVLQQHLDQQHGSPSMRLVIAGRAPADIGQKVHNQLAALDAIDPESDDGHVWVFADTDAVPGPHWLANLVGPVSRKYKTGMTTGYRWLIPHAAAGKVTIWSHLASICNSSVACQFGPYRFNHAWGGSMAVNVGIARRGSLRQYLKGAITEDYQFTHMCRNLKLRVEFVPRCLIASPVDFDRPALFNFAHRQYLITRIYAPRLYATALALTSLYVAGFLIAVIDLSVSLARSAPAIRLCWPIAAMALAFLINQGRATLRRAIINQAFGPAVLRQMKTTLLIDRWLTPLWMALHCLLILRAAVGNTMTWRGIRYRLQGRQKTQRLD